MKLVIITSVVNNIEFIKLQYETLKKYVIGDYEFVVFNDAKEFTDYTNEGDITIKKRINETCKNLGIKCFEIENENHKIKLNAAQRTADTINLIYDYQKIRYETTGDSKYLIIDSDMFLIDYFDINRYERYSSAIVIQDRGEYKYIWNGIYYMDMDRIRAKEKVNWNLTMITDVGGMMREWLYEQLEEGERIANVEEIRWNEMNRYNTRNLYIMKHLWSLTWSKEDINDNKLIEFLESDSRNEKRDGKNYYYCEIYDGKFLHLRNGGNWRGDGIKFFNNLIKTLK
jgi:hypothetical protein